MEATTVGYKLIKRIKDDKFNVDDLQHYSLSLQIGVRDFQLCIIDTKDNRCLLLEDYVLGNIKSHSGLVDVLQKLFEGHHLLMAGFWKSVKISFKNNKFSLVPSSLFVKEALFDYLKLNCDVNPDIDELLYYKSNKSNVVTVFAVNKKLFNWAKGLYPNLKIGTIHQSCSLTEGCLALEESNVPNAMYLYIDRFKLHIVTMKANSLEYYNQFSIKQFSDYTKYIMMIVRGLYQNQGVAKIVMWGYLGKKSPHYSEFTKHIKNLSFGERPQYLKFGYMFDEVQDHHFFDLYNIYLCD